MSAGDKLVGTVEGSVDMGVGVGEDTGVVVLLAVISKAVPQMVVSGSALEAKCFKKLLRLAL